MKIHKPLPIPEDSAWDRKTWKTYIPIWLKEIINGILTLKLSKRYMIYFHLNLFLCYGIVKIYKLNSRLIQEVKLQKSFNNIGIKT
jgi:hypothetical protein